MALIVGLVVAPVGAGAEDHEALGPVVYDIEAAPDGSILIAQNTIVRELRRGELATVAQLPVIEGEGPIGVDAVSPVNGLAAIGRGSFFATLGGLDSAEGAGLYRVSRGNHRLVADIAAFERAHDPDSTGGEQWKDPECEAADGYTAGPQSNPYHLTALSGSEVLIGDAAGNTLLAANTAGDVDWVAVFPPAYDEDGDWLVQQTLEDGTECFVQPVPTSVDVGPDGAYYVAELSGTPPDPFGDPAAIAGLARVWRIESDARNVACPSDACELVVEGLTSVIDAEFGPDGRLYVVEIDDAGWFAPAVFGTVTGGSVKACDVEIGACEVVEDGLTTPGALTFDKWGRLWVVEGVLGLGGPPEIHQVDVS